MLSMAMFSQAKCLLASKDVRDRTVIFPDMKNLKKQSEAAAHSITMSASDVQEVQCSFSFNRIASVIGNHIMISVCWLTCVFFGFQIVQAGVMVLRKTLWVQGGLT